MSSRIFYIVAGGEPRSVSTLHRLLCALGIKDSADYWSHKDIEALSRDVSELVSSYGELEDISFDQVELSNFDTVFTQRATEALDVAFKDCQGIVVNLSDMGALSGFWLKAIQASGGQIKSLFAVSDPESLATKSVDDAEEKLRTWLKAVLVADTIAERGGGIFIDYAALLESWIERLDDIERITKTRLPDLSEESFQHVEALILRRRIEFGMSRHSAPPTSSVHPFAVKVHEALLRAARSNQKLDSDIVRAIELHLSESPEHAKVAKIDLKKPIHVVAPVEPADTRKVTYHAGPDGDEAIPVVLGNDGPAESGPVAEISSAYLDQSTIITDDALEKGAELLKKTRGAVLSTDLIVARESHDNTSELLEEIRDLSQELSFYTERKMELERELYRLQDVNLQLQEENRTLLENALAHNKAAVSQPLPDFSGYNVLADAADIQERVTIAERERDAAQERVSELSSEVTRLQQYADNLQATLSHSVDAVEARAIRAEEAYNLTVQRLKDVEQHVRNVEADREKTVAALREALEHEQGRGNTIDHERGLMAARVAELSMEIMRIQSYNERNMVSRDIYVDATEQLNLLEQEVLTLRQEKMDAMPLLREREAILASNSWKLTALPRAILTVFRARKK